MASKTIGNLKVQIGADTADLSRGIGRAKAMVQGFARVAKVASGVAAASFAAASAGLSAMTGSGLSFVDAQAKMARSVDGTIDGLRALQIAGGYAGASVEQVNSALQNMGKRLSEAAREGKGPAAEALHLLGLEAQTLLDLDVDKRFSLIADRMNAMGLSAQDASSLMRDLGVRSSEVSLVLLQGSGAIAAAREEVEKFGLSLSADAVAGVERANDALSKISFVFESLRNQLAVQLAPLLETLAVDFQNLNVAGGPLQSSISILVGAFSDLAKVVISPDFAKAAVMFGTTLAKAVTITADAVVLLAENSEIAGVAMIALGGAMAFFSGPIGLAIAAVAGGALLLSQNLGSSAIAADEAVDAEMRLHKALGLIDQSNSEAVKSGASLIEAHMDEARSALGAAQAQLTLARAREQAGLALLNENPLTAGGNSGYAEDMAKVTATAQGEVDAIEAQLSRLSKMFEGFKRSSYPSQGVSDVTGGGSSSGGEKDDFADLLNDLQKSKVSADELTRAKALLKGAFEAGSLSIEDYKLRLAEVDALMAGVKTSTGAASVKTDALSNSLDRLKDKQSEGDQGKSDTELFVDDLSRGLSTLEEFSDAWDVLADTASSAMQKMAQDLIQSGLTSLFSDVFGLGGGASSGGGGGFLAGLFGSIPAYASGTDSHPGGLARINDGGGGEIVNLPTGAQVIPHDISMAAARSFGGMAGSGPQNVHITVGLAPDSGLNIMPMVTDVATNIVSQNNTAVNDSFNHRSSGFFNDRRRRGPQ